MTQPLLSIVVPMYNESEAVEAFFAATIPVLEKITSEWEIIAVDDGSRDDTFARLQKLNTKDARIKAVSFSRNFGKEAALTAGIDHVSGKAAILLDADLQDPPALIPQMVEKWREGYKVVLGQRKSRSGESALKVFCASAFYWFINRISDVPVVPNTGDFRLMDMEAVQVMRQLRERNRFMRGLLAWSGLKQCIVQFDRPARDQGETKYSFFKSLLYALDGIISLSDVPLRLPSALGLLVCGLALFSAFFWQHLIFSLLFFCVGLQFLCLGLLGEYLARVYREARDQPLYYVSATLGQVAKVPANDPAASSRKGF